MTLEEMRARRDALLAEQRAILDAATAAGRADELTEDEARRFDAAETERRQLDTDITAGEATERADTERRDAIAAVRRSGAVGPVATIGAEPQMYGREGRNSYFLDLLRAQLRQDPAAIGRLERHAAELRVELPAREARRADGARRRMEEEFGRERRGGTYRDISPFERETRVNPNRVDGQGGYFVPPLWLVDEYVPFLRNGRPFAEIVRQVPLPDGTDSINIPKVLTGTVTSEQADGGQVASQDLTDTFINAPVRTIAGQQDIAMQLLDQSPISFDEIVFQDLIADYNAKLDTRLLSGTGAGLQIKGLDFVSGTNSVTYTDASPTLPELYLPLAQALSQVARLRKMPPTAFVWQSTRWYWGLSQLDTQNRPLVVPYAEALALNPEAIASGMVAEGPAGTVLGTPVVVDQNITTTDGAGANQDRIYAVRSSDFYLWEGSMRTRTLTEVLSGTLQVRVQVYNYVAFSAERYATSTSIITGTGLTAPSGF